MSSPSNQERRRRWRLVLGENDPDAPVSLSERDGRIDRALGQLYDAAGGSKRKGRGGLGGSAPRIARWLGDIREFFPTPVVQIVQKDAMERLGMREMLLQPEMLSVMEADVHLVADLIALGHAIPAKTKDTARAVVRKVVDELLKKLEQRTVATLRGAIDRSQRTSRPRLADVDWPGTIRKNLHTWQPEHQTIIPERLVGRARRSRRQSDLDEVFLCVDQSGSMATSVVYASIFAAVMASIPAIATHLVCFDTQIVDLTDKLSDPVDVLFGVQLGGGTDIAQAVRYTADRIQRPARSTMVLISDLYEGGDSAALLRHVEELVHDGVRLVTLLALSDDGAPAYDATLAASFAALGSPVFACTPDQFPGLMAAALKREDLSAWAAERDIALVRGDSSNVGGGGGEGIS
ncbi:MAG: VWA domain-containing protein [Planctomycetota bacterium]